MASISRQVVLVTGANSGIGYETVKALLESNKPYHILLGARTLEKATTAVESLEKEVPQTSSTIEKLAVDLNSDESIEKAFEQVKAGAGRVDTLVNNAGPFLAHPPPKSKTRLLI
jgi:NADP-dependent 3-hydroxy acid dehydrogenase YdfG